MSFKHKGFTIVELLIVIVVMGVLASLTIVAYSGAQKKALNAARTTEISQWLKVLQAYDTFHGALPPQLGNGDNYCLGDNFTDVTGDGIGDCRDVGANLRPGDPVHVQSVNTALLSELRTVSSTLPRSSRTHVGGAYVGPYLYRWTGGEVWLYTFLDGDHVCPSGSVDGWADSPRGVSLCRWRVG